MPGKALDKAAIGARIRALREARGWSQQRLAEAIGGASVVKVNRWERGKAWPETHLKKLCELFAVTAEHLVFGQREPVVSGAREETPVRSPRVIQLLARARKALNLSDHELEGLALMLKDSTASSDQVMLALMTIYADRKKE